MKYVIFTLQEMTPEQLKQNPITIHPNRKLITDEYGDHEWFNPLSERNWIFQTNKKLMKYVILYRK